MEEKKKGLLIKQTPPKKSVPNTIKSTPKPVAVAPRSSQKAPQQKRVISSTPKPVVSKNAPNKSAATAQTPSKNVKVANSQNLKTVTKPAAQKNTANAPKISVKMEKSEAKSRSSGATLSKKFLMCAISLALAGIFFLLAFLFLLKRDHPLALAESSFSSSQSEQEFVFPNYDHSQILGTVSRPTNVQTFGDHEKEHYPSYFNPLSLTNEEKQSLLDENMAIIKDTPAAVAENRLKKHISADGQFYGSVPDSEARIVKKTTINHLVQRRHSLGVFAPAGEILTVTIDESLVGKNLNVMIGYPRVENNIPGPEKFGMMPGTRMPYLNVSFRLTSTETKIGSPFGGMVILEDPNGIAEDFSITVSGGVDSPDYQLGVSTKEDWQEIMKKPSPYVWLITPYVYHIAPKAYLKNIDDPYDALMLWHKAANLSLYTIGRDNFTMPIMQIYDDYVPSGGGVAFVWGFFSIMPASWSSGALSYDGIMRSGSWGNFHEFNHHNQALQYYSNGWGIGENGEVTNNALNAMTYIAYTDIAATRTDTKEPANGNWEVIVDPYYNYRKLTTEAQKVENFEKLGTNKVFAYADLMHNFGVEKFAKFVRAMYGLVEGYEENNLISSNYYKTEDGFALLACKIFEKDFVDYFTKVWKLNLSQETIDEIKSLGYDEFFSLSNVYSAGIKGLETGRAYKVNIGVENVFDFDGKVFCSAEDFVLKKVGKAKNGTLTKNADGTYSYSMNEGAKEDEFDLEYEVLLNGKKYSRTLVVKLVANTNFVEKTLFSAENGKNILDIIQTASDDTKVSSSVTNNITLDVENGINLTRFRAQVVFPETKELTFLVYGDDKTYAKIDGHEIYTNTYMTFGSALNQPTNKIKMTVQKDVPISIEAFCYNTGGAGGMNLKISEDGTNFSNIPDQYFHYFDLSPEQIEFYQDIAQPKHPTIFSLNENYFNQFYANKINLRKSIKSITVQTPDGQEVLVTDGSKTESMYDGNTATQFHTAWTGKITPMPHEYYVEFENEVSFNQITFRFGDNTLEGYYAFGDFELYSSDDGLNYSKFYEGHNTKTTLVLDFEKDISAKFVKLVVKSDAYGRGSPFTSITEIEFSQTFLSDTKNVVSSTDDALVYEGNWTKENGISMNGSTAKTENGSVKFAMIGTALALYSINDISKIIIDGKEYDVAANTDSATPSFVINNLAADKTHIVEIKANNMLISAIKANGEIKSINDVESGWLSLAVIIVLTVLAFVILAGILLLTQKFYHKKGKQILLKIFNKKS